MTAGAKPQSSAGERAAEAVVAFGDLGTADLVVDALYAGGARGNTGDDPIARLIPGVGNQGGFRYSGSPWRGDVRLVVLYTTGDQVDWPDYLDPQTGLFTYFGDNRSPGNELHVTRRGGNLLLRDTFAASYGTAKDRSTIPPFLLFEKAARRGRDVRFRGLLAPGGPALTSDDELQAVWRTTKGRRFQNYRARFTVLDRAVISREWVTHLLDGGAATAGECPAVWQTWVHSRAYVPLTAPATTVIRTRQEQLPEDEADEALLATLRNHFVDREHDFEACAVALWRFFAPATGQVDVTRPSRDGGRDAVGQYHVGPPADRIAIEFALEAKCYAPNNSVGVREGSRLISRLRHRDFGVIVTTSYFNEQLQREIRDDQHPIALVCARDIVKLLRQRGYTTRSSLQAWLNDQFPAVSA